MHVTLTFYTHATGWYKPLPDVDSTQTLVMIFGDPDALLFTQTFQEIRNKYPQSLIAGCSGMLCIFGDHIVENALVVAVTRFVRTQIRQVCYPLDGDNSWRIGRRIAEELNAPDLKGIFILADGLATNGTELVAGLNGVMGERVAISGGLAGDKMTFDKTWVLADGVPKPGLICGIGFYGRDTCFKATARDGWKPFGPERMITRSEGNVLFELDGRPALELYKDYLGERAKSLPGAALHFPLAIWDQDNSRYVVRTILGVNEDDQSMRFAGDMPHGFKAQLMYGSFDNLVEGAETAGIRHHTA